METSQQGTAPPRSRWRSWAKRFALAVTVTIALVVAGAAFVLSSLDAPWLKRRLQAQVREASHLEVDWAHARLSPLTGLWLEDVHVRSPAALQATAPDFVHLGRLEATWSLSQLLASRGPLLDTLTLQTLEVTAVTDVQRGTSTGLLFPDDPAAPVKPPGPGLSSTLQSLFAGRPLVALGRVEGTRLAWRKVDHDQVVDEASVEGLALRLEGWRAHLGNDQAPLELRALGHHATLKAGIDADASPSGAALHAEADVEAQDFEPALHLAQLLRLDGRATFDPHGLSLAITEAKLLDGAVAATAGVERADDGAVVIHEAFAHVDAAKAAQDATALGFPVSAAAGSALELKARGVRAVPAVSLEPGGALSLVLTALDLRQGQSRLTKGTAQVRLAPVASGQPSLGFSAQFDGLTHAGSSLRTLGLDGTAAQAPSGWHGEATVELSDLVASDAARLAKLAVLVKLDDVVQVRGATVPVSGRAEVIGTANGARFTSDDARGELADVRLTLAAGTTGHPPFAASAEASTGTSASPAPTGAFGTTGRRGWKRKRGRSCPTQGPARPRRRSRWPTRSSMSTRTRRLARASSRARSTQRASPWCSPSSRCPRVGRLRGRARRPGSPRTCRSTPSRRRIPA